MTALTLVTESATLAFAASTYTDSGGFAGDEDDIGGVDFTYFEAAKAFSYNHALKGLYSTEADW